MIKHNPKTGRVTIVDQSGAIVAEGGYCVDGPGCKCAGSWADWGKLPSLFEMVGGSAGSPQRRSLGVREMVRGRQAMPDGRPWA